MEEIPEEYSLKCFNFIFTISVNIKKMEFNANYYYLKKNNLDIKDT